MADSLDLTKQQIVTLARNSFRGSFLDEASVRKHVSEIDTTQPARA
jgi:adenine deaminase